MDDLSGKLLGVFYLSALLSCVAAWVIARRYRAAMRRLMSAPLVSESLPPATVDKTPAEPPPAPLTWAENRRALTRLSVVLVGLSCVMAATAATLWMWASFPGEPLPPKRLAAVALLMLWPVVPALGLLWRWSRWRVFGALVLWCAFVYPVLLWRSIEPRPLQLLVSMMVEMGTSIVIVALMMLGPSTRPIATWLFLPCVVLVGASLAGFELLIVVSERLPGALNRLDGWVGAPALIAAFVIVPWVVLWWPLRWLGRGLGRAYSRRWLSELMVVFFSVWAIVLLEKAIVASSAGPRAAGVLLALLWIPPVVLLVARRSGRSERPPTLLVLRVFQHDAQVQDLFDHVIERWRATGNTVMIAGTDLADRTLDAADLFTFLDRRLAERFVRSPADIASRLAAFDTEPDLDGRFRVSECYCHNLAWQAALTALVDRTDVALLDLRGFKAHNAGCRFELRTLAMASRPLHAIVLVGGETDRAAVNESIADGRTDRFTWIEARTIDRRTRRDVLMRLFDGLARVQPSASGIR